MERFSILNPNLFEEFLATCDSHLNAVMIKILKGEFGSGDIDIKISLSAVEATDTDFYPANGRTAVCHPSRWGDVYASAPAFPSSGQ